MTPADLIAERDALLGIAQEPSPRALMEMHPRWSPEFRRGYRCVYDRVRHGWDRVAAEEVPMGQKRGPKPLPPEERAQRDRARWRARYAEQKAKRAQRAPEGPDADPM